MDINFEYYKIFYYVAKYKNITKAATALGSSQPNITRIMKLLESQLNCKLFSRGSRGISLTEEGELLYSHAEIAYRQLLNAQEEIYRQDEKRRGTIEIGATETALQLFLLDVLCRFKLEYPGIRIKIHNHATPDIVRQLVSGKLDFAVITTPFGLPGALSCVNVLDFEEILVGGNQYGDLCRTPLALKELSHCPWIGLGQGTATYDLYRNFFLKYHVDMNLDMEVATSNLMLPLIENNLGIGFVPEKLAVPLLEQNRIVHLSLNCHVPKRSIQIVSDKGREKSPAAIAFYQYLNIM